MRIAEVYKTIKENKYNEAVSAFLAKQPTIVSRMLVWEASVFDADKGDPTELQYYPTSHPNLFLVSASRLNNRRLKWDKRPLHYACANCCGRLFVGSFRCGWCNEGVFNHLGASTDVSHTLMIMKNHLEATGSFLPIMDAINEL